MAAKTSEDLPLGLLPSMVLQYVFSLLPTLSLSELADMLKTLVARVEKHAAAIAKALACVKARIESVAEIEDPQVRNWFTDLSAKIERQPTDDGQEYWKSIAWHWGSVVPGPEGAKLAELLAEEGELDATLLYFAVNAKALNNLGRRMLLRAAERMGVSEEQARAAFLTAMKKLNSSKCPKKERLFTKEFWPEIRKWLEMALAKPLNQD